MTELDRAQERVAELKDTIRLERALIDYGNSYGRNQVANRVLADITERRGEEWSGAFVSYERATS